MVSEAKEMHENKEEKQMKQNCLGETLRQSKLPVSFLGTLWQQLLLLNILPPRLLSTRTFWPPFADKS
jgi:hypothetical protein